MNEPRHKRILPHPAAYQSLDCSERHPPAPAHTAQLDAKPRRQQATKREPEPRSGGISHKTIRGNSGQRDMLRRMQPSWV